MTENVVATPKVKGVNVFDSICQNIESWDIQEDAFESKYGCTPKTLIESIEVIRDISKDVEVSYGTPTMTNVKSVNNDDIGDACCDSFYQLDALVDTAFSYISYTLHSLVPKEIYRDVRDSLIVARKSTSCNEKINSLRFFLKILLEMHFNVIESFCRNLKRVIESFVPENPSWGEFIAIIKSDVVCYASEMEPGSTEDYKLIYDSITDKQQPVLLTVNIRLTTDMNRRVEKIVLVAIDCEDTEKLKDAMSELFGL